MSKQHYHNSHYINNTEENVRTTETPNIVRQISSIIGPSTIVSIIDVLVQEEELGWTFKHLCDYFDSKKRLMNIKSRKNCIDYVQKVLPHEHQRIHHTPRRNSSQINANRVYNQASFAFSNTNLSKYISSPQFVKDIYWIDKVWPDKWRQDKKSILLYNIIL
jgi:hypothetical protein